MISVIIVIGFLELYIRFVIFNNFPLGDGTFRNAYFYGDYYSDRDYWKLNHVLGGKYKPPENPHPLLGWVGDFDRVDYRHNSESDIGNKTPVVLYGDSFAECSTKICFQDLLNTNPEFSNSYFLLNYGVSGYGTDQIKLLYENSIVNYPEPIVVISLLTKDLDRSILDFRIGQKPYYELIDGTLELKGLPILSSTDQFLKENPIEIQSYLWNYIIYRDLLPENLSSYFQGRKAKTEKKILINDKIIQSIIDDLRKRELPFFFIVFHSNWTKRIEEPNSWRDVFLRNLLERNQVPYIWSKDIILQDAVESGREISDYFLINDGHYNDYTNGLIADEIKEHIFEKNYIIYNTGLE